MTTFVLVHGTGDGSWIWQRVIPLLRARGHEVYAPTLSGVGDRAHLLSCGIDLTTHITDVASLLTFEDLTEVVLVGHSYAGMVITGVAGKHPERLRLLVYLDAYVPEDGEAEVDLWPPEMRAQIEGDAAAAVGLRAPPPLELLGVTDPEDQAWMEARATPHPMATYLEPVSTGGARSASVPRAFVHCTQGQTTPIFAPFAEKARARGWPVRELATGHCAMVTVPYAVADVLIELAAAAAEQASQTG